MTVPTSHIDAALDAARGKQPEHLELLKRFLEIPSVSTLSEHKDDVARAAEFVAERMRAQGMQRVDIMETGGHPLVYGEWLGAPGKPTVLIYGHYDVQPADPLDEWRTDPFTPTEEGDCIVARGASDMKAQILGVMNAVACLAGQGPLPVNIKYMVEGEEEVGSPNLLPFLQEHKDLLACDFCFNCDTCIEGPATPSLTESLRGLAYFDVWVHGPEKDLHSGMFGGAVHNPAHVLCELIAGMHDAEGRITLPGFYDSVRALTEQQRSEMASVPFDEAEWLKQAGVKKGFGEQGYSIPEQVGARPTLEVNGLLSGFTGEGSKTVLPAKAMAKLSMRLVPDQDPAEVRQQLEAYLKTHCPSTCTYRVTQHAGAPPGLIERDSEGARAAIKALTEVFGKAPVFKRIGGTVPVVAYCKEVLGVDTVMMGFALPDDGIHGPNERQHIPTYYKGIETVIRFLGGL